VKVSKARHLARFRERLPARSTEVWRRRAKRILRVAIKGLKMASNNLERWLHSNEGFDARSSEHLRLLTLCKGLLARTKLFCRILHLEHLEHGVRVLHALIVLLCRGSIRREI
jgi:hypothetical protein